MALKNMGDQSRNVKKQLDWKGNIVLRFVFNAIDTGIVFDVPWCWKGLKELRK